MITIFQTIKNSWRESGRSNAKEQSGLEELSLIASLFPGLSLFKCYGMGKKVLGWKIPKRKLCATAYKDWGYSITFSGTLAVLSKKKKKGWKKSLGEVSDEFPGFGS